MADDDEFGADLPIATPKKSAAAPPPAKDGPIVLSVIQTINLLDPDGFVMSYDEADKTPKAQMDEHGKKWAKQFAAYDGLVRFQTAVDKPAAAADKDEEAEDKDGEDADEDADEEGGDEEEGKDKKQPALTYVDCEFALGMPLADSIINPKEISVAHEKRRYQHITKSQLLFSNQTLAASDRNVAVRVDILRFALQRVGRPALLGTYDLIGGLVTFPGVCLRDATPSDIALLKGDDELELDMIKDFDKNDINGAACIFTAWSRAREDKSLCPRLTQVRRVKMTLSRYIEELKGQLHVAEGLAGTTSKKAMILQSIKRRLQIAQSYMTDKPATEYVLPKGTINPDKVVLDLYVHRLFCPAKLTEETHPLLALNSKAKDPEKNQIEMFITLAKHENTAFMAIDVVTHDPDDTNKRSPMRVLCAVPMINFNNYLKEVESGNYAEGLKKVIEFGRIARAKGQQPKWKLLNKKKLGLVKEADLAAVEPAPTKKAPATAKKQVDEDEDVDDKRAAQVPASPEDDGGDDAVAKAIAAANNVKVKLEPLPSNGVTTPSNKKKKRAEEDEEEEKPAPKKAKPAVEEPEEPEAPPTKKRGRAETAPLSQEATKPSAKRSAHQQFLLEKMAASVAKLSSGDDQERYGAFAGYNKELKASDEVKQKMTHIMHFFNYVQLPNLLQNQIDLEKKAEEEEVKKREAEIAALKASVAEDAKKREEEKKKKAAEKNSAALALLDDF